MSRTHHALDYVEIAVSDLKRARAFYGAAFGWQFNDYGPGYAGIRSPDGEDEVGGLNATASPRSGGPLVLLRSADLDGTAAAVAAAGGVLTLGPYAFPGGRRFHFTDLDGTELGVWAPDRAVAQSARRQRLDLALRRRRRRARRSSSVCAPHTPCSTPASRAQVRHSATTGQRRQMVRASSACRMAGPVLPIGKNSSGSSVRQAARCRQLPPTSAVGAAARVPALLGLEVAVMGKPACCPGRGRHRPVTRSSRTQPPGHPERGPAVTAVVHRAAAGGPRHQGHRRQPGHQG